MSKSLLRVKLFSTCCLQFTPLSDIEFSPLIQNLDAWGSIDDRRSSMEFRLTENFEAWEQALNYGTGPGSGNFGPYYSYSRFIFPGYTDPDWLETTNILFQTPFSDGRYRGRSEGYIFLLSGLSLRIGSRMPGARGLAPETLGGGG